MRRIGVATLAVLVAAIAAAPLVAPHDPNDQFRGQISAPPMWPRVVDIDGWHAPFVYRWRLVDRLERRYELDISQRLTLRWFSRGKLVRAGEPTRGGVEPLLLLGADSFGRDVFSRLLKGGQISLAVAALATLAAVALGVLIGGASGYVQRSSPAVDEAMMRAGEFVIVLPTIYVVLVARAAMPLVVPPSVSFALISAIFALVGWPYVARGVRAIVATEHARDYAVAAESLGASPARVLWTHLLPATRDFIAAQATVLVPAFIVAEATLSYVGFGFPDTVPSWGTMLQEASNVSAVADFPWVLAPALAIFAVTLSVNLIVQPGDTISRAGASGSSSRWR